MQQRTIANEEIEQQTIYRTESWAVLLPERPVSPYHFLMITLRDEVKQYTDLKDDALVELRDVVSFLVKKIETSDVALSGYNLFSNNGTYEIGQHLSRFHQHIFIRPQDETESPYAAMAEGRRTVTYWMYT